MSTDRSLQAPHVPDHRTSTCCPSVLPDAAILGQRLSGRYAGRCRGVEVAAATAADFAGYTDAAYGYRVFLRHYCVHLAGPDPSTALPACPADARAARGLNGDLGQHLSRWRQELESAAVAADLLGVLDARKALLAVAGLVSVHDHTWTTDRSRAARRWSELEPRLAAQLALLHSWAERSRYSHGALRVRELTVLCSLCQDSRLHQLHARFGVRCCCGHEGVCRAANRHGLRPFSEGDGLRTAA